MPGSEWMSRNILGAEIPWRKHLIKRGKMLIMCSHSCHCNESIILTLLSDPQYAIYANPSCSCFPQSQMSTNARAGSNFVFLFKSIVFIAEYLRPFVVAVVFLWKWNNNLKKSHSTQKQTKVDFSPLQPFCHAQFHPKPLSFQPRALPRIGQVKLLMSDLNIPDTFVHSKYWKLHQAARWFYKISLNTEPTVNIRLQKISIPGKHGYEPDSGHDPKIGFTEQVADLRLKIPIYCNLPLFFSFFKIMSTACLLFL